MLALKYLLSKNVRKVTKIVYEAQKLPLKSVLRWAGSHHRKNVYLIDEEANYTNQSPVKVNKYAHRTFTCGELRPEHIGLDADLCGWLEFQRMGRFVVIRDGYGQTQLVINDDDKKMQETVRSIPLESVVRIKGTVLSRPKEQVNPQQATGEIEVVVGEIEVLNVANKILPFNIRKFQKAKEPLRMKYRYMDMRFENMQRNLRMRSEMCMSMREFLIRKRGFVEVETPTLFKATPGGAQEFIVPTRFPNEAYSLVQSPQQFKQMLMAGAIDRYFQIARCYRDETTRPDRQPEFTQLDIEMSFTDREGVMELTEELLQHSWPRHLKPLPQYIPKMTYDDVMNLYGTDKPDLRFNGFKIRNCTDQIRNEPVVSEFNDLYAGCLIFDDAFGEITNAMKKKISANHQLVGTNLFSMKIRNYEHYFYQAVKVFGESAVGVYNTLQLKDGTLVFIVYGERNNCLKRLGRIREDYIKFLEDNGHVFKPDEDMMSALWVVDFPVFETCDETGALTSMHHPFTAPKNEDLHYLTTDPLKAKSLSYDLVLNGSEIAGGSVRIHDRYLQHQVLELLNIDRKELKHMLEMLASGCPPHGGIALGLDRLLATILQTPSIRDVIAFPKTFEGRDPITGAPSPLQEKDKKLYHIQPINI